MIFKSGHKRINWEDSYRYDFSIRVLNNLYTVPGHLGGKGLSQTLKKVKTA